jgi:hypothetical protein
VKHRKEGSCWVDEHGFRARTPLKALPQEDKEDDKEDDKEEDKDESVCSEDTVDRFERNERLIKRYSKRSSLFAPSPHHQTFPELSAEEKAFEEKHTAFKLQSKEYIKEINILKTMDPLSTDRICLQCYKIAEFYNYLLQHAEFVATKDDYRNYSKRPNSKKHSFMQVVIKKCVQLAREVTETYDKLRTMNLRANPELRKAKANALAILEKVKQVYAEYYVKYPFESEPLADLLSV